MKGVAWEKKVVFESPPSPNPLIEKIRDLCLHDHALTIFLGAKPDAEIMVAHQRALEQMNVCKNPETFIWFLVKEGGTQLNVIDTLCVSLNG